MSDYEPVNFIPEDEPTAKSPENIAEWTLRNFTNTSIVLYDNLTELATDQDRQDQDLIDHDGDLDAHEPLRGRIQRNAVGWNWLKGGAIKFNGAGTEIDNYNIENLTATTGTSAWSFNFVQSTIHGVNIGPYSYITVSLNIAAPAADSIVVSNWTISGSSIVVEFTRVFAQGQTSRIEPYDLQPADVVHVAIMTDLAIADDPLPP